MMVENGRMYTTTTLIALLLVALTIPSLAQEPAPPSYFPLASGHQWTYFQTLFPPPDFEPDTLFTGPVTIGDPFVINDTSYYQVHLPYLFADTLRVDDTGRVWAHRVGQETLLFDFTRADGDIYTWSEPELEGFEYTVTVRTGITLETPIGRLDNCMQFYFDIPEAIDDERRYVFAPDVGLAEVVGVLGDYWLILDVELSDQTITSALQPDRIPALLTQASSYPNPFQGQTTIAFHLAQPAKPTITIFDSLGRQRDTWVGHMGGPGFAEWTWNAWSEPSGVYFARIQAGRAVQVVSLMHQR